MSRRGPGVLALHSLHSLLSSPRHIGSEGDYCSGIGIRPETWTIIRISLDVGFCKRIFNPANMGWATDVLKDMRPLVGPVRWGCVN